MNLRTLTATAAGIAFFSCMVTLTLWRELHDHREVTAALNEQLRAVQGRVEAAETALENARASATRTASVPPPDPAPEPAPTARASGIPPPRTITVTEGTLLQDPEYRSARIAQLRLGLRQQYPGVDDALGLSSQEADQLFELLATDQTDRMTMMLPAQAPSNLAREDAVRDAIQRTQARQQQLNESLRAMLGESRFQQWQEYQATRSTRLEVNGYANSIAAAGLPLSKEQNRALVAAVIAEQRNHQVDAMVLGRSVIPADPATQAQARLALSERQSRRDQRILDAAATALTAQQLDVLRAQLEQAAAAKQAQEAIRERTRRLQPPPQ